MFRKRCLSLAAFVLGYCLIAAASGQDKKDEKDVKANVTIKTVAGNKWDPADPEVKAGDVIEWKVEKGFHGLAFKNGKEARGVLEFLKGGIEVKARKGFDAPIEATHDKGDGMDKDTNNGILVRAKVKEVPKGMTELPFFCTVHGETMSGKLKFK